jgi:catechol 2,3-dioxygenase-like lactoylglutathione lyase family enzyme
MLGYITMGTNNIEEAASFYDELFGTIGAGRSLQGDTFVSWSAGPREPAISVTKPFDGEAATVGNGGMVAITLGTPEKVDAFHAKALELGGTNEGAPGTRFDNFYAAYFRDLDGNKLSVFCLLPE